MGRTADRTRSILLLGHGGSGKTALAEALLDRAGVEIPRGGVFDTDPEERERECSLGLSVASFDWRDHRIALLDAPGRAESYGDAFAALPAADAALFVVDAATGLGPQHDELWEACDKIGVPRLVVLSQLDRAQAKYQDRIDALRGRTGKAIAAIHMPLGVGEEFEGVIDLMRMRAVRVVDGKRVEGDVPEERRDQAERNRADLVESIVEHDDELLERYLDGETPSVEELDAVLARGVASGGFCPVLCASATEGRGMKMLADALVDLVPSIVDRPLVDVGDDSVEDAPPACVVAKTVADPYVGRVSALRVVAGKLSGDDSLVVARTGQTVRLRGLLGLMGREHEPVERAVAGEVVGVAKLEDVRTGDVLHTAGRPVDLEPVTPPPGHYRVVVSAAGTGDEDKLSAGLARISEEDPSLRIERDDTGRHLVLAAYGPSHVSVATRRLARLFGVQVETGPVPVAYRETVRGTARAQGKHVKQSGGHGQYGIAEVIVSPVGRGEGFTFTDSIVGGVIPRQFIPSVEKGIREAMGRGILAGYPVVDVSVELVDGKHHSVDSSDVAFQTAGSLAFRAACEKAGMVLLEPVVEVVVTVEEELVGDVMGDLSSRRGRISGTDRDEQGRTVVTAHVPEAETATYVAELRSLTSGAGRVSIHHVGYEEVPEYAARQVVEAAAG